MPFSVSAATADAYESALRTLSNNVIGVTFDDGGKLPGITSLAEVTFNCEHDLVLALAVTDSGKRIGVEGYGTAKEILGSEKTWEDVLTSDAILGLANENDQFLCACPERSCENAHRLCQTHTLGAVSAIELVLALPKLLAAV